jgi:hypothetical protein
VGGRGREVDPPGQLYVADASVILKLAEDGDIKLVKIWCKRL